MIEAILPPDVAVVEAHADALETALLPEEESLIARAVGRRRREFATGRACAREALRRIGLPESAIGQGERGEPCWPDGVVGSITHCDGYRAVAVADAATFATIGIDAEPHGCLPLGVLETIGRREELRLLERLGAEAPDVHWDRLLFSAKESVYKAWFPIARQWIGFQDAIVSLRSDGTFTVRVLLRAPGLPSGFDGRWQVTSGLLATAIAWNPSPPETG